MYSYTAATLAFASLALRASTVAAADDFSDWAFGNMFAIGPASNGATIAKATYSLVPPPVPCGGGEGDGNSFMSIWVGVSTSTSDNDTPLVQPLLNWSPNQESQGCPASVEEWCVAASTFYPSGQVQQDYVTIPKKGTVDFEIDAESTEKIISKVWVNGEKVSEQTDTSLTPTAEAPLPTYFFSSNECYQNVCGSLNSHEWTDIVITLTEADKSFGDTLELTGATSDGLTTSDGGKTWTAKSIKINGDVFPHGGKEQTCKA
ncbi:uncharacterized protein K452DRAFT_362547 [Aplosporella prunicola CBS 121167]|uniref:Concanavalin A-like lectin/glucanase n=1 Tax=Aplosporella prunicola CBS 121167 TaxID=1176127 RepID=A0A6A6AXW1_9PEZI|nr:uncharacterized protein K452DRAFT_362547 [Aplosporella prunicola CBS 121167]KAF2136446.1 hypothetical protein K452DRAFT_362547 [Aplosporella prunicola CBS 121167]